MTLVARVTKCCNKPVMRITGREYPDGRTFYISTSKDICSGCSDEWPITLDACDFCGDASEHLTETKLGMYCKDCCISNANDLMERV